MIKHMDTIKLMAMVLCIVSLFSLLLYFGGLGGRGRGLGLREIKHARGTPFSKREKIFVTTSILIAVISYFVIISNL